MNTLFLKCYPQVINWKYSFFTRYSCHFDENGPVAWAHEVDSDCGVRFYTGWDFLDVPCNCFEICDRNKEGYVIWDDGKLDFHSFDGKTSRNLMYIHLQKRPMTNLMRQNISKFAIARCSFFDIDSEDYRHKGTNEAEKLQFIKRGRKKDIIKKILNGAVKAKIYRTIFRWKRR